MKNFPLATLIDTFLTVILGFLFCFLVLNYFVDKPYSIIIAISLGVMFALLVYKVSIKKFKKRQSEKAQTEQSELVINQLDFLSANELTTLFFKALEDDGKKPERKRGYIYLKESKTAIFLSFGFENKNKKDIVKAYTYTCDKEKDISRSIILAGEFPAEIIEFANRFGGKIKLVYGNDVYKFLLKHDNLPKITCEILKTQKIKRKKLSSLLYKKNSRKFLLFGFMFLLMSYVVPIKLYYLIFGGIMLIFGFTLMFFGKYTEEE